VFHNQLKLIHIKNIGFFVDDKKDQIIEIFALLFK